MYKVIIIINVILISAANTESVISETTTSKNVDESTEKQVVDEEITSSVKKPDSIISSSEINKEINVRNGFVTNSGLINEPELSNDKNMDLHFKKGNPPTVTTGVSVDNQQDKITTQSPDIEARSGYDDENITRDHTTAVESTIANLETHDKVDGNLSIEKKVEVNYTKTFSDIPEPVEKRNERLSSQLDVLGDTPLTTKKYNYDYTILDMKARNVENKQDDVSGSIPQPEINIPRVQNIRGNAELNNSPKVHNPNVLSAKSLKQDFSHNTRDIDNHQAETEELNRIASHRRSGLVNSLFKTVSPEKKINVLTVKGKSEFKERTIDDFNSELFANAYPYTSENSEEQPVGNLEGQPITFLERSSEMSIFEKLKEASEHPIAIQSPKLITENYNQHEIQPYKLNFPIISDIPIKPNIPNHQHFNPYQYINRFRIWPTVTVFHRQ